MRAPCGSRRLAVAAVLVAVLALSAACDEPVIERSEPKRVVVEGVVVEGDTFRVDPLDPEDRSWSDRPLPATVRLQNEAGTTHKVDCDRSGRFRVGPMLLKGAEDDQLVVSCPGKWTLRMSRLLPSDGELEEASGDVVLVRRKITLPPRGGNGPDADRRPS